MRDSSLTTGPTDAPRRCRLPQWISRLAVPVLATLGVVLLLLAWLRADNSAPAWDTAEHYSRALVYRGLLGQAGSGPGIAEVMGVDRYYPPLAKMVVGLFLVPFQPTMDRAIIISSSIFLFLLFLSSFAVAARVGGRRTAVLSVVLLAVHPQVTYWSRLFLLDVPNAAMVMVSLAAIMRFRDRRDLSSAALLAAAVAAGMLTKWTHAAFLCGPLFLLWRSSRSGPLHAAAVGARGWGAVIAAATVICCVWYVPNGVSILGQMVVDVLYGAAGHELPFFWTLDGIIARMHIVLFESFGFILVVLAGAGMLVSRREADDERRFSVTALGLVLVGLLPHLPGGNLDSRLLLPVLPVVTILAAWRLVRIRMPIIRYSCMALCVGLMASSSLCRTWFPAMAASTGFRASVAGFGFHGPWSDSYPPHASDPWQAALSAVSQRIVSLTPDGSMARIRVIPDHRHINRLTLAACLLERGCSVNQPMLFEDRLPAPGAFADADFVLVKDMTVADIVARPTETGSRLWNVLRTDFVVCETIPLPDASSLFLFERETDPSVQECDLVAITPVSVASDVMVTHTGYAVLDGTNVEVWVALQCTPTKHAQPMRPLSWEAGSPLGRLVLGPRGKGNYRLHVRLQCGRTVSYRAVWPTGGRRPRSHWLPGERTLVSLRMEVPEGAAGEISLRVALVEEPFKLALRADVCPGALPEDDYFSSLDVMGRTRHAFWTQLVDPKQFVEVPLVHL